MSRTLTLTLLGLTTLLITTISAETVPSWEREYRDADASGDHVIALWQFNEQGPTQDSSGNGHTLNLRGRSSIVPSGRFGSCLESFGSGLDNDVEEGTITAANPVGLTPAGAFTIEMWIKPKPEFMTRDQAMLIDRMYIDIKHAYAECMRDYRLWLRNDKDAKTSFGATLGFGDTVLSFKSAPLDFEADRWHHLAFTYDGAGTGVLYVNAKEVARQTYQNRAAIAAGTRALAIGDRYGSTHRGFAGFIDQVRITDRVERFVSGKVDATVVSARTVFERMETGAEMIVAIHNDTGAPLTDVSVLATFGKQKKTLPVGDLADDARHEIHVPVDTTLRPSDYELEAVIRANGVRQAAVQIPVTLVARPQPDRMPVVMWGSADDDLERMAALGFTQHHVSLVDYARVWEAGEPTQAMDDDKVAKNLRMLDDLLRHGLSARVYPYAGRWLSAYSPAELGLRERFNQTDRAGEICKSVDGNFPEAQEFCYNVGASIARTFGTHPALRAALIDSEVRDMTQVSFREESRKAFRDFAGFDIPAQVEGKGGVNYSKIPGFSADRIVSDNDPLLVFYRWFWSGGDGWPKLHTQVHEGLKSTGRTNLLTSYDPAVRVPNQWGSGGGVDMLGQWTYTYPDPIKIGQATDDLLAMADAKPGQQVMKGTQIIWYRRLTTGGSSGDGAELAPWEQDHQSDASYITIAPDHLREAFWCKIARPIQGIFYHGWSSLVEVGANDKAYRFTNPDSQHVLSELMHDVVQPLGPALRQIPDRAADVALLESFTSQMFAGRGSWGWSNGWDAQMHMILQYAQLQPRIVYEQTLQRDGLEGYKVLVMPHCDVLPRDLYNKIADWQRRGGIIVADEHLAPALTPNILISSIERSAKADEGKAQLLAAAAQLRTQLDASYQRYGESDTPDVIVRFRRWENTDYLFAINDRRTFGNYVGQHGLVMEQGVPITSALAVYRAQGTIYDLLAHKRVESTAEGGTLKFNASFGPGDGRLFMITDRPVAGVQIQAPTSLELGKDLSVNVTVVDANSAPINAVVPVHIELLDPQGRAAELSGPYAAKGGKAVAQFNLASNDLSGTWTVQVRELASGTTATSKIVVRGEDTSVLSIGDAGVTNYDQAAIK